MLAQSLEDMLKGRKLSPREIEVVAQVLRGVSHREVGKALFISEKTVKFHMTNIFQKLQLKNRVQLFVFCHGFEIRELKPTAPEPVDPNALPLGLLK